MHHTLYRSDRNLRDRVVAVCASETPGHVLLEFIPFHHDLPVCACCGIVFKSDALREKLLRIRKLVWSLSGDINVDPRKRRIHERSVSRAESERIGKEHPGKKEGHLHGLRKYRRTIQVQVPVYG